MKRIFALLLILLLASTSYAAEITSTTSGNFSTGSTWVGGVAPAAGDTFVIGSGNVVTVVEDAATAGGLVATNGKLILADGVKMTTTGLLTFGNATTPRTGYLEFRAGAELALGGDLALYGCALTTNGTTRTVPAVISGTGAITSGTSPRGLVDVAHMHFRNTNDVTIKFGTGASSVPSVYYKFVNCVFGPYDYAIGASTTGVSNFIFDQCDFRGSDADFYFSANSGVTQITNSTAYAVSNIGWAIRTPGSVLDLSNSVFQNISLALQTKTNAAISADGIFTAQTNASGATTMMSIEDSSTSGYTVFEDSFFYTTTNNIRYINAGGTAVGVNPSASHSIRGNVFQSVKNGSGNPIVIGPTQTTIERNLMLGTIQPWASRAYSVEAEPQGLTVARNTQYASVDSGDPALVSWEQGTQAYNGTVDVHSNLVAHTGTQTWTYSTLGIERGSVINDSVNILGHNAYFNPSATIYQFNAVGTDLRANDLALTSAPTFSDTNRTLETWGAANGADGSVQGAIDLLLARNGYNSTAQSQTGTASSVSPSDLVSWVRAGYVPTTSALEGAGYLGVDIGALDYGGGVDPEPEPEPEDPGKFVSVTLYSNTTPLANMTGLTAIWWDVVPPLGNPAYSTASASTNANGTLILDLSDYTSLNATENGFLFVYEHNATDYRKSRLFGTQTPIWEQ